MRVKEKHGDNRNRTRRESLGSLDVEREDGRSHPRPSQRPKPVVHIADRQTMKDNILPAFVRALSRTTLVAGLVLFLTRGCTVIVLCCIGNPFNPPARINNTTCKGSSLSGLIGKLLWDLRRVLVPCIWVQVRAEAQSLGCTGKLFKIHLSKREPCRLNLT